MTAGYSGTPLPRKLGIRPGARVALSRPPDGFAGVLGELPVDVRLLRHVPTAADVVVLFARRRHPISHTPTCSTREPFVAAPTRSYRTVVRRPAGGSAATHSSGAPSLVRSSGWRGRRAPI